MATNQLLPHINPEMIKKQPDQTALLLNRLIDEVNRLSQQG